MVGAEIPPEQKSEKTLNPVRGHRLRGLFGSSAKAVAVLTSGAFISQLIGFAGGAVLARFMYPPEAQDLQAGFAALLGAMGPAMALRYDMAIILPDSDDVARNLCCLCLWIALGASILAAICMGAWHYMNPSLPKVFWALPVAVFSQGTTQAGLAWCTRKKLFSIQSFARITQALTMVVAASAGFWLRGGVSANLPIALTIATVASAACLLMLLKLSGQFPWRRGEVSILSLISAAGLYRRLPLVNLPMNLADMASQAGFIWFLGQMGGGLSACYAQSTLLMRAPMQLLGTSVGQVFASRAARVVSNADDLRRITVKTMCMLTPVACGMIFVFALFGPWLFGTIYGEEWRVSGQFAQILVWGVAANFIISPVSILPTILNENKGQMFQAFALAAARIGVGCLAWKQASPYFLAAGAVCVELSFCLIFGIYVIWLLRAKTKSQPRMSVNM